PQQGILRNAVGTEPAVIAKLPRAVQNEMRQAERGTPEQQEQAKAAIFDRYLNDNPDQSIDKLIEGLTFTDPIIRMYKAMPRQPAQQAPR
ncbi:MAG: hypothetical protein ACRDAM_21225, partial [Casimicrobium sp.]